MDELHMVKCSRLAYVVLLIEFIKQEKSPSIYSKSFDNTISNVDFNKFPLFIRNSSPDCAKLQSGNGIDERLSSLYTKCKVNINYITKKISPIEQRVNPILYDILKNTEYHGENIVFRTLEDKMRFLVFKSFKSVNAAYYDEEKRCIKKAMKSYGKSHNFKRYPYNKEFEEFLGPNSVILINQDTQEIIYSNRCLIEYEDFFDDLIMLPEGDILNNIFDKLSSNKVYEYAYKKKDEIYNNLENDIIDTTQQMIQKLIKIQETSYQPEEDRQISLKF